MMSIKQKDLHSRHSRPTLDLIERFVDDGVGFGDPFDVSQSKCSAEMRVTSGIF